MEVVADRILRASNARLRCLAEAIEQLQGAGSQDQVMGIMRRTAHRLCDADGVSVVRRGGEQSHCVEEGDIGPLPQGQRFPLLSCIAGWAMRHRCTAVVADAHADRRIPEDARVPASVRSVVAVPVGAEAPGAVIGVYWSRIHTPDREEVSALEALARSAAGAFRGIDLLASLTRAKDRAEEADRAKSRFLAAASHDLRQPVMAAGLYVDLLARRLKGHDDRALADMVRVSLDGLRGLLNGLLETARLEAGVVRPEMAPFALDDLLQRLSVEFEAQALASRLWLQVPHTLAVVLTDCLLLELILRNLIGNALKYTRRGGVTVEAVEEEGTVRIDVRDTGLGIPADQLDRIFDDFYRIRSAGRDRGFGLGLATVRRAAAVLGHEVTVRSEPGRGSAFSVRVPCAPEPPARPRPAPQAAETGRLAGLTVLVAEDDPLVAEALGLEFGEWGLDVVKVAGLAELHACIAGRDVPVDLVVSDYQLGDGNGMEAIRAVRSRWQVPAILLTGDTGAEVLHCAKGEGVHLLHKPVLGPDLAQAVARVLGSGRHPI